MHDQLKNYSFASFGLRCVQKLAFVLLGAMALTNSAGQAQSVSATPATGTTPYSVGINAATNKIYVANQNSNSVTVIDGSTNTATTVNVGTNPVAVAVNPVTNKTYVANKYSNTVSVIDGSGNVTSVNVGASPSALAVNPVTNKIYVANSSSASVTVIDGATNTPSPSPVNVGTNPIAVAVNPVTNIVYVANLNGTAGDLTKSVTVINGATLTTSTVAGGTYPLGFAVNPVTNKVYVTNANTGSNVAVTIIDGATNTTSTVTAAASSGLVAANPVTNKIYVANGNNSGLWVIDANNANSLTPISLAGANTPYGVTLNPTTNKIYVTDYYDNKIFVVDGATNSTTTLTGGGKTRCIAVNPVTNKAYAVDYDTNLVTVIDGSTNATSTVTTGSAPTASAFNTATNKIYVANASSNNVTVIDGATNLATSTTAGTSPAGVAVNPVNNKVYVTNSQGGNVTLINVTAGTTSTVTAGTQPQAVAVNPVTSKAYVANYGSGNVTIIDGTSNAPTNVTVGTNPCGVAVNPATNKIYVTNYGSSSVSVIDGTSNAVTPLTVGTNPCAVAVNPITNKIYVGNRGGGNVSIIDGTSNAVTTLAVGTQPWAIAVNPITNTVYVANNQSNNVSVIAGSTGTVSATVAVGSQPQAIAVNKASNKIYVANFGGNSVTVIDGITNGTTTVAAGAGPNSVLVNPLTNEIYITNSGDTSATVIQEAATQSIPLTTAIASLANNITISSTPSFNFTANSTTLAPPTGVFYQVDTLQKTWTVASGSNPNFTGTTSTLQPGFHTLYAFAIDGQETGGDGQAASGFAGSPVIGQMQAYNFLVVPPTPVALAVSAGSTGTFSPSQTGVLTVQVTNNATYAAVLTSGTTTVVDTLPTGFTFASASGTDWSCGGTTTVTCTTSDAIAGAGGQFPLLSLTVNIASNDSGSYTNNVAAYGGGDPTHTSFATAVTATTSVSVLLGQTITFNTIATQTVGTPLTLSATASSGLTVSFSSTTPSVCTVTGTTATFLASGSCSITASQAGNSTYGAATPVTQSFNVVATQTITFGTIATQTVGTPLTLSATASSGLAVSYSSATTAVCTVTGSTATFLVSGTCSITASQAGNSSYAAATPVTQTFNVQLASQTITFGAIATQVTGTPLTLTATASSGLAVSYASTTNSVCTVTGSTASFLTSGTCSITASQAGNSSYAAATPVTQSFNVLQSQTITFGVIQGQTVGSTLTLTATASSGLTVSYASTTTPVCTVTGSTATFIASGTCSITASQAGNSTYAAATPVTQSFSVALKSQTITFNTIPTQIVGTPLALSATASSGLAVSYASTTPTVCTVTGATASFLANGTCSITASQAGNGTYGAATPVTQSFTVVSPQTITFGAIPTQVVGTPLTLSATASSGLAVSFASSTTGVCTVTGTTATFLTNGTCSITASQAGNSSYAAATPVTQSFSVLLNQTITFSPIQGQTVGGTLTLGATASSGLVVSYASTTTSICTVTGSTASFLASGTCSITASQAGNGTYAAAAPVTQSFSVALKSQTITFNAIPTQIVGTPLTLSATATSGLAVSFASTTGTVCTVSGTTATFLAAGTCSITASQAGNATYGAATPVTQSFSVLSPQTITFGTIPTQVQGTPLTLSATASSGLQVSFASNTTAVCTVSGATATFLSAGLCSVTASQAGNGTYAAATPVTQTFSVLATQSITFGTIPTQAVGVPLTLGATASSGLAVSYASTTTSICTVSGNTATFVASGTCSITASQAGNATYAAAAPVTQSFTVALQTQSITFGAIPTQLVGTPLTLSATASSGLTVSYASTTTAVCTVSGNSATFLTAGTCSITASQAGNSTYGAATPVTQSFSVLSPQTITFSAIGSQIAGTTLPLTATASSGLTVSYASTTSSVCTVTGSTATLIKAGTCSITASQAGNTTYAAATPVTRSFSVLATQTITFPPLASQSVGAVATLNATASSGLPVSYTAGPSGVCSVSGNTASFSGAGQCTITATQPGDGATYAAAAPVQQVVNVLLSVTVGTNVPGLAFVVDGITYTSTQNFQWTVGAAHTIGASTPQTAANALYSFSQWSDGGALSHSVTGTAGTSSYVATFIKTGSPLLTGTPGLPGNIRNDYSGFVGMQFTVGAQAVKVFYLGRIYLAGNTGTHTVKLVNATTGLDVPNGSVSVTMTPGTINTYQYVALATPVLLQANTSYFLVTLEAPGGDTFYDSSLVTADPAFTVNTSEYQQSSGIYAPLTAGQSFGTPNLLYSSGSNLPTVSIVSPVNNATVNGTIQLVASATAANGATVSNVQFVLNGVNYGAPVTALPYQVSLNTATLVASVNTMSAIVTDSNGNTATATPVTFTVSSGSGGGLPAPLLTSSPTGALRNDYSGYVGMQFVVGNTSLTVSKLGRFVAGGNSGNHIVKIVNADGSDLAGGSVTLSLAGASAGGYAYATLAAPVTLQANSTYYLVSQETANGDFWADYAPVTANAAVTVNGPAYLQSNGSYATLGGLVSSYVTPNLLFTTSGGGTTNPPTVTITSPASGSTVSGSLTISATATPAQGLTITSTVYKLNGATVTSPVDTTKFPNGSATLVVTATDSNSNTGSASVTFTINNGSGNQTAPYLTSTPPAGTALRNDFTGFVGMQFTTGSTPLTVTQLGRWMVSGNSGTHVVKLVAANGTDIPGGSVTLNLAGQTPAQYAYANLASAVTLAANTTYYLVSQEAASGDMWYDYSVVTVTTGQGAANAPVYFAGGSYLPLFQGSASYVPANFQYLTGPPTAPPTVTITSPTSGSTVSGSLTINATATPAQGLTITNTVYKLNGTTVTSPVDTTKFANGSATLVVTATDSNANTGSASVTFTINNQNAPPTVSITSPTGGSTVSGSVTINATATPAQGLTITNVLYKLNGTTVTSPVDTTKFANGSATLVVTATDSNSNTGSASVTFTINNAQPPPTVTITSPTSGSTVSGSLTINATATPAQGLTITSTVYKLNGTTVTSPVDTTKFAIGSATLVVTATDSAGNSGTASVTFNINNSTNVTPFVTSTPPAGTSPRNDFSGFVGMQFTTGPTTMTVTQVGRWMIAGNTGSHVVKLVTAAGSDIPGGSATLNLAGQSAGQYVYASLAAPITLAANTSYYLMSQEAAGGDMWYDYSVVTVATGSANAPVYLANGSYLPLFQGSASYVPPNFLYTGGTAPTPPIVTITSPASGATVLGTITLSATATPSQGLTIASTVYKLNGNTVTSPLDTTTLTNGPYTLVVTATDSAGNTGSASVTFTVNNPGGNMGTPLLTGAPASGLRNDFPGFVGMEFTVGAAPINVSKLGRWIAGTTTAPHTVKLVDAITGNDIGGGSVAIPAGATAGGYAYATLPSVVTLAANHSYFLMTQETVNGDLWYDATPVTPNSAVTVNGPVYQQTNGIYTLLNNSAAAYGTVSLLFTF